MDANVAGQPDTAEFIELHDNPFVTLEDLSIVVYDGATDLVVGAYDLDGYHANAGGLFVLGGPGVPGADLALPADALPDAGAVVIYIGDAVDYPVGSPVTTFGHWEAVIYGPVDPGLAVLNSGTPPLEDALGDGEGPSNQRTPNGADSLGALYLFAQGPPTPGRPNVPLHHTEPFCSGSANSVHPEGARLFLLGSGSVVANDSVILVDRVPDQLGYLVAGSNPTALTPMGDGQLCLGWPNGKLMPVVAQNNVVRVPLDLEALLYVSGANSLWFQFVYRDTQGQFLNVSEGLRVVFTP
ncbi:MAG: hypothetical protein O2816_04130 [Planctomycetota bacterium]|nr:hypothetical protein [Planctomycetota bacterium]